MGFLKEDRLWLLALLGLIFLLEVFFVLKNSMMALLLAAGLFLLFFMLQNTNLSLTAAIIVLPISASGLMQMQILGIPGLKPANLIILLFIISFVLSRKKYIIWEKTDIIFYAVFSLVFFVSVIRSMSFVPEFYSYFWTGNYTPLKYVLSYWLLPYLFSLCFLMVIIFIRTDKDIKLLINAIFSSMCILSVIILYIYIIMVPNKIDFQLVRLFIGDIMGMHGNEIAGAYIITYPLLLTLTINNPSFMKIVTLILSIISVAILYSRTAYLLIILATIIVILSCKKKWLIPIFAVALGLILYVVPASIADRAMTGIAEGDLTMITAGRVDDIWVPLIRDLEQDPIRIISGYGRFGIIDTPAFKMGEMARFNTSHNIFLDMILDAGIFSLMLFLMFYGKCIKNSFYIFFNSKNSFIKNLALGVSIGLISSIIDGFTGGTFFPKTNNAFVWVLLGLSCVITYRYKCEDQLLPNPEENITPASVYLRERLNEKCLKK